jgi:two-component response regulator (ARR-B family)
MSVDDRTSTVMKGIRHGACDYFIKPVRLEELRNIWQHVARKFLNESKEHDNSGSIEDNDRNKRGNDDNNNISSAAGATKGIVKEQKKRGNLKDEEDVELENDDPSTSKKPRVVWSVELHQQFVSAVNQLGLDSMNFQLFFFCFCIQ